MPTPSVADGVDAATPGVLLVTLWYGGTSNGVALVVESLAQSLHHAGVPVVVLELVGDGWLPRTRPGTAGEEILSVCIRDPGTATTLPRRIAAHARAAIADFVVRRAVRRRALGVAHFHYGFAEYDVVRRIVQRAHLPIVATFHGNDLGINTDDPPTRGAIERLVRAASVATTVSDALGRRLVEIFPFAAPIARTIHNAVPAGFLHAVDAQRSDADSARDIDVLFAGNLIPRKGVDVLLRALAIVRERRPTLSAVIAGHGTESAALESLAAQLALTDAVRFVGRQERDALVALFRRARVAAVPSRAEPFGLVVVEAMVCGTAVVASEVGGIPEIAAQTGGVMLVPPDDPAALAHAIVTLLDDPVRRETSATTARANARRAFGPETIRDHYIDAYRVAVGMDGTMTPG